MLLTLRCCVLCSVERATFEPDQTAMLLVSIIVPVMSTSHSAYWKLAARCVRGSFFCDIFSKALLLQLHVEILRLNTIVMHLWMYAGF